MRNLRSLLLALVAVISFVACGGPTEEPPPAPEESAVEPAVEPSAPVADQAPAVDETPAVDEPSPEAEPSFEPARRPGTPPEINKEGKIIWRPDLWENPPLGLPPVPDPRYNRSNNKKADLGRRLFFDKRLSKDGTVSCASCHHPSLGFSNAQRFSPGIGGQVGTRNAPTIYNVAYATEVFWDGRSKTLEHQAIGPIINPIEMGNTINDLVKTVNALQDYRTLFREAFNDPRKIMDWEIVRAIAAFERTILSGDAPYDRFKAGELSALSAEAKRGLAVFEGRGRCVLCHGGANFTDGRYHNIGVGTGDEEVDVGRMTVTTKEGDWAKFKTPTLRNNAVTGPYMHDGSMTSLEEVVTHYVKGGIPNKNLDPLFRPLDLTKKEQADLVTFLEEGLTREIEIPIPTYDE